jgi:hypothetical protein
MVWLMFEQRSPTLLLAATTLWPTAARLAGAFARMGWRVELLAPAGAVARHSRFVSRIHDYSALAAPSACERAVSRSQADLVIPCDDRAAALLLDLHARAREAGPSRTARVIAASVGMPAAYPMLIDRARFAAIAEAEGIIVPPTRAIANEAELEQALTQFGFPAVLKSDGSWGGDGVAILHSREEALAAFRRMSRPPSALRSLYRALRRKDAHYLVAAVRPSRPRLSLQAYVDGAPATMAFAAWQGEVLASIHADVVATNGDTGPSSVVEIVLDPAMEAAARKLARRFGLSGLHGLDFIRDARGRVHLLEINARATQICALAAGEGRDLPAALAACVAGRRPQPRPAIDQHVVALFPQEWSRDPASDYLLTAHHDVPWDDPALIRACLGEGASPAGAAQAEAAQILPSFFSNPAIASSFDKHLAIGPGPRS